MLQFVEGPPLWVPFIKKVAASVVNMQSGLETSYNLVGQLYLSRSGWLLLSVPNVFGLGVFKTLNEPGIELPVEPGRKNYNAHISVMNKKEVEQIGADKITERGKQFRYGISRLMSVEPDSWEGVSRVWFVRVISPELQLLRRSYGLSPIPDDGKKPFHITVAIRKTGVLGRNENRKG